MSTLERFSTLELIVLGNLLDLAVLGLAFGLAGTSILLLFRVCFRARGYGQAHLLEEDGMTEEEYLKQSGSDKGRELTYNDEEQA